MSVVVAGACAVSSGGFLYLRLSVSFSVRDCVIVHIYMQPMMATASFLLKTSRTLDTGGFQSQSCVVGRTMLPPSRLFNKLLPPFPPLPSSVSCALYP